MIKRIVRPQGSPVPGGSYSQVVIANGFVFVAGQSPHGPNSEPVPVSFKAQVQQVLKNIETALKAAGSDLEHIVKVNAYLKDLNRFDEYNEIYKSFMPKNLPARTTIASNLIGMEVEIDCIAALKST
jgi:2-iminobutanoate/2-iminopropanoate deaminase